MHSRNFKTPKGHEDTETNKGTQDFSKHQTETKDTIKRKIIYALKKTTQNIKEELNKDMENLRNPGNKKFF
jgi:gamma-glutamyl phosphate reductase